MDREGTPRRLRAVPNDATQVQFATLHGYKRAYRRAGSGPAVLLLHGIGDNSLAWEPLFAQLSEEYTVIAPDFLGHGFSDRPRADYSVSAFANGMRDLLTYLDIERVTVVGHSLGGGVAGQFAYQYPELVERLVLVGTGGVTKDVNPALRALSLPFSEYILGLMSIPAVFATFSTAAKSLQNLIPATLSRTTTKSCEFSNVCRRRVRRRCSRAPCAQRSTGADKSSRCSTAVTSVRLSLR